MVLVFIRATSGPTARIYAVGYITRLSDKDFPLYVTVLKSRKDEVAQRVAFHSIHVQIYELQRWFQEMNTPKLPEVIVGVHLCASIRNPR